MPTLSSSTSLFHPLNLSIKPAAEDPSFSSERKRKMAAGAPVAIGTRGTVGSLVRKEIEYFTKLEIDTRGSSSGKAHGLFVDVTSCSGHSRRHAGLWFSMRSWRRKKQRGSTGFLPSMCSVVEVADSNQLNSIPGFHYRILKNDQNNFHF